MRDSLRCRRRSRSALPKSNVTPPPAHRTTPSAPRSAASVTWNVYRSGPRKSAPGPMNARTTMRAQEISARAMERAQRSLEKSRWKMDKFQFEMIQPNAPLAPNAPVAPMPIDFEVNLPSDFSQQVQAAVEGRVAVKCVRTKVAAQQYQTVMIQRANQNMANNVHIVVSTQDVSGLAALTQSPKSQTALHRIEHDVQRLQDHILSTIDRAFATL